MMKCTMVFSLTTALSDPNAPIHRTGGWTENHFVDNNDFSLVRLLFQGLCETRAQLLPTGASITGQRYQRVSPVGASQSTAVVYPGASGLQTDVPQMALLCRVPTVNARNVSRLTIRGIPDARVVQGEYSPSYAFNTSLRRFFTQLSQFMMEGRDLSQTAVQILFIQANGNFRTIQPHGLAVNNQVQVIRSQNETTKLYAGGKFVVTAVTDNWAGTLNGWTGGDCRGGTIRIAANAFYQLNGAAAEVSRVVVRKVGRPSVGYRGRR